MTAQTLEFTLGDRLAKARKRTGMTQQQLADRLGIDRKGVIRYESDLRVVPPAIVIAWSHFTDVSIEWLNGSPIPGPDGGPDGGPDDGGVTGGLTRGYFELECPEQHVRHRAA